MVKTIAVITDDVKAIMSFVHKYFLNDMIVFSKTALLCKNTQIPEKPNAAEIIEILKISDVMCAETYLIPVVISKKHRIEDVMAGVDPENTFLIKLEITEKITM